MRSIDIETPENFPQLLEEKTEHVIGTALQLLGLSTEYPRHTREVLGVCHAFGYAIDEPKLSNAIVRGEFEPPEFFGLELAWKLQDIKRLILWLDQNQAWLPGFHNDRKTEVQVQRDREQIAKIQEEVAYYETLGDAELENLLRSSSCNDLRAKIRTAMQNKYSKEQTV